MTDGIYESTKNFTIAIQVAAPSISISCSPAATMSWSTNKGVSGPVVQIGTSASTVTFPAVLPGDIISLTFSATGYITQTVSGYVVAATSNPPINVTLVQSITTFQLSTTESPGATNLYAVLHYVDGATSDYINLGHTWPITLQYQTGTIIEIHTCIGGDKLGICSTTNIRPSLVMTFTVIPSLATNPVVVNFYSAPPTYSGVKITSSNPKIPDGLNGYISVYVKQPNGTYPQYPIILGQGGNTYSLTAQWPTGTDLTIQFVYHTGTSTYTVIKDFGSSLPYQSIIDIGTDVMFMFPVTINTNPEGAWVYVNPTSPGVGGMRLAQTPISLTADNGVGWGEIDTLEYRLDNYQILTKTYQFGPGLNQAISETLTPLSWPIPITSNPSGATVNEVLTDGSKVPLGKTTTSVVASYGSSVQLNYTETGYTPYSGIYPITIATCIPTVTLALDAYTPYLNPVVVSSNNNPKSGDTISLAGNIVNNGGVSGSSTVWVYFNGAKTSVSQIIGPIAPGANISFYIPFTIPVSTTPGQYQACLSLT